MYKQLLDAVFEHTNCGTHSHVLHTQNTLIIETTNEKEEKKKYNTQTRQQSLDFRLKVL